MEMSERIPLIGEKFPELEVDTTQGRIKLPDAFSGKWFVIFSHPGDFTPVCTTEFVSFAKRYQEFKNLNTELIGLSVDSNISHIEWVNWIEQNLKVEIPFPIIADPMGNVAKKLGMLHAESSTATVRAVFIVDPKGIVRLIMYYPLEIGRNISEILRSIKALQLVDKTGNVIPANWPNNEIIGDNVLNPPPRTVKDSRLRLQQFKGFAWWLTYKEVDKKEVEEAKKLLSQR
ncbi:1-Cys peroxiredoxin [Metallosphaera sedula]|uniref:Peroxiredoxin n=4 Tax=Metallosphaera TaxID=41980 RepID=A4YFP1_METS5|nr:MULTISPECIES: peroxiredoxin [Metallosphaera]ABP95243.1 1-Cys peroxiredoxin [Metallosphaera sedula DSM 5348]AIM27229.1 1-Cys peroxiredoxin [Metallosphaera sedula]MCY0863039.1 peroxiredoxin [Metallosphaera prunae]BBL47106.1 peroxiredoxin [Metallosphaera sedula]